MFFYYCDKFCGKRRVKLRLNYWTDLDHFLPSVQTVQHQHEVSTIYITECAITSRHMRTWKYHNYPIIALLGECLVLFCKIEGSYLFMNAILKTVFFLVFRLLSTSATARGWSEIVFSIRVNIFLLKNTTTVLFVALRCILLWLVYLSPVKLDWRCSAKKKEDWYWHFFMHVWMYLLCKSVNSKVEEPFSKKKLNIEKFLSLSFFHGLPICLIWLSHLLSFYTANIFSNLWTICIETRNLLTIVIVVDKLRNSIIVIIVRAIVFASFFKINYVILYVIRFKFWMNSAFTY